MTESFGTLAPAAHHRIMTYLYTQPDVHVTGRRVVATFIDGIVLGAINSALVHAFAVDRASSGFNLTTLSFNGSVSLLVVVLLYYTLLEGLDRPHGRQVHHRHPRGRRPQRPPARRAVRPGPHPATPDRRHLRLPGRLRDRHQLRPPPPTGRHGRENLGGTGLTRASTKHQVSIKPAKGSLPRRQCQAVPSTSTRIRASSPHQLRRDWCGRLRHVKPTAPDDRLSRPHRRRHRAFWFHQPDIHEDVPNDLAADELLLGQPLVHCYLLHAEWIGERAVGATATPRG